jgi:transposase
MDVIAYRAAGLDVHRSIIAACVLLTPPQGRASKERRQFATTASGLADLAAWLKSLGVTHVGMESTGVYWMPVYAVLERAGGFDLIVANAQHIKAVPGRKTDVKDAEWLAELVRFGLMRKSFVPPKPIRDLRDLTRYRRTLAEVQGSERRRLIKLLEATDIKLAEVVSDVFGKSGRAMVRALIAGETSAEDMARLARGNLRKKIDRLREALAGRLDEHHREMLSIQLARVEAAEADIETLDKQISVRLAPYDQQMALLTRIPGIDWVVAATIIAEIGADMSVFPTAGHLSAWAGVCPGNNQSAGKNKPAGARKGNIHLKTALCNAAIGASRKRDSFFKSKYTKLKIRRGGGRAALAIGHKLLVCAYHILSTGTVYTDLGEHYQDRRDDERTKNRCIRRLEGLGYKVTAVPVGDAANAVQTNVAVAA